MVDPVMADPAEFDAAGDSVRVSVNAAVSARGSTAGGCDSRTTAAEGLVYAGAEGGVTAASAGAALELELVEPEVGRASGLSGAPMGLRAGPWGVATYSYRVADAVDGPAGEFGWVWSLTMVFRFESPVDAEPALAGLVEPVSTEGDTAIAGLGVAVAAGWALPRPSEYPKPKKIPQISTAPKKTPSSDFMPSVISVSVPSFSSSSMIDLISA
jgi:hypothetical protein